MLTLMKKSLIFMMEMYMMSKSVFGLKTVVGDVGVLYVHGIDGWTAFR